MMDDHFKLAIDTIYDALTTAWEDNGNIMADAVRDSVITNLSKLTGVGFNDIVQKVEKLSEERQ